MRPVGIGLGLFTALFGVLLLALGGFNLSYVVRGTAETPALNAMFGAIFAAAGAALVWVGATIVRLR